MNTEEFETILEALKGMQDVLRNMPETPSERDDALHYITHAATLSELRAVAIAMTIALEKFEQEADSLDAASCLDEAARLASYIARNIAGAIRAAEEHAEPRMCFTCRGTGLGMTAKEGCFSCHGTGMDGGCHE